MTFRPHILAGLLGKSFGTAVYPAKTGTFSDSFTGTAASLLRNRSGWSALDATGAVTTIAAADGAKIDASGTKLQIVDNYTGNPGAVMWVHQAATVSHVLTFKLASAVPAYAGFTAIVAATNTANGIYITAQADGSGNVNAFQVTKYVSGSPTTIPGNTFATDAIGRPAASGDTIEIRVYGSLLDIYVNGRLTNVNGPLDLSTGGAYTPGTYCGFGCVTSSAPLFDDVYVADIAARLTATVPYHTPAIYATAQGVATASGTYSGTLSDLDYQVYNRDTGTLITDWTRVPAGSRTISGGAWSANITLTMNNLDGVKAYKLQFRAANDTDTYTRTPTATAAGITVGFWGQSNSGGRTKGNSSPPLPVVSPDSYYTGSDGIWKANTINSDPVVHQYAQTLSAKLRVPVGVVVGGISGTPINFLSPGQNGWDNYNDVSGRDIVHTIANANATGKIHGWLWTQGEGDAYASAPFDATLKAAYKSDFGRLVTGLRSMSVSPTTPIGIAIIGSYEGASAYPAQNWPEVRRTLYELGTAGTPGVYVSSNLIGEPHDSPPVDPFHYLPSSYMEMNRRDAHSASTQIAANLGISGVTDYSGYGAYATGATRSGNVITLSVNLNGATSISGTGLTNYEVSTDNFATTKTISSAAVSGSTIVITLAADPGAAVQVRSFYGLNFGTPTFAQSNYADSTSIPVAPIYAPVTSN